MKNLNCKYSDQKAFTLIEVLIAVVLLAASLVTLFGLLTSAMSRSVDNNHRLQAVSITRTIFSLIEQGENGTDFNKSGPAAEVIQGLANAGLKIDKRTLAPYSVNIISNFAEFPGIDDKALKRVTLRVAWGDRFDQSLTTDYFISSIESDDGDE